MGKRRNTQLKTAKQSPDLSAEALHKLVTELRNLPEWLPPKPESPEQIRERLIAHLRSIIVNAEAELARLRRPEKAWKFVSASLTDLMPAFGYGDLAERVLGPVASSRRSTALPTRELKSFTEIERELKRCPQCRAALKGVPPGPFTNHAKVRQAQHHHKKLFRRYLAELSKPIPAVFEETPSWAAAYRAATANEALASMDSPMAVFAAGAYLERQDVIDYLVRTLPGERGKAVREALAKQDRNWREKIGRKKRGRILPHTALVRATVEQLKRAGHQVNADAVLAVLTGEAPDTDEILEKIRWDLAQLPETERGRQTHSAIDLPDDPDPPVAVEDEAIFFRFKNRPERKISIGRFRNIVSELAHAQIRQMR